MNWTDGTNRNPTPGEDGMSKTVTAKEIVDLADALLNESACSLKWKMHPGILEAYRKWSGNPKATANDVVKHLEKRL